MTHEIAPKQGIWRRTKSLFAISQPDEMTQIEDIYPTQEDLDDDADFNRAVAEGMVADFGATTRRMQDVSVELSKWILTSLLAVNSGGLIAVGQLKFESMLQGLSAGCFTLGLLLPLFAAHLSIRSGILLAFPL